MACDIFDFVPFRIHSHVGSVFICDNKKKRFMFRHGGAAVDRQSSEKSWEEFTQQALIDSEQTRQRSVKHAK